MPNERNVEALAAIIDRTGIAPQHHSWARAMAKALAAEGVLVPIALTESQAASCIEPTSHPMVAFSLLRQRLEGIAKGEPG